jgi:hypothetical protein
MAGPTVSHDRFSDGALPGRIRIQEVPVEVVPILSTILVLIGLFLKPGVLIRKKPCNLAALYRSRKNGNSNGLPGARLCPEARYCQKIKGVPYLRKTARFFRENYPKLATLVSTGWKQGYPDGGIRWF